MKLKNLLNNQLNNYLLPFFWQHSEDEKTLREYMQVIKNCHIDAVCIESRPHPEFGKDKWWKDLDIIFDEAKKLKMKVWILDDSHFPSGYANGTLENGYPELHRQFVVYKKIGDFNNEVLKVSEKDFEAPEFEKSMIENFMMKDTQTFDDNECLGFISVGKDIKEVQDGETVVGSVYGLYKTRNWGPHRDYINMASKKAVRKFIDEVYEKHYEHYKQYFGNVLEGFFSDEPEIGNGHLYGSGLRFYEMGDLPFSEEIDEKLKSLWDKDFVLNLGKIFFDKDSYSLKIKYMDILTNTIKEDFSCQIGDWCRERNVKYIGHSIEDHNQHSRTGSGLGHYFRGLKGMDFAGIDDIGGQVIPLMEDATIRSKFTNTLRDGTFFHFTLGKLASSFASIDPLKKGDSMCEIFGNYGWEEGVYLEKYLIDHFMVRGINHFVPHAFSPKEFPDSDCPPHFYAHGNNPQYRHFGELMKYTNRICNLISGGRAIRKVALLYHGEADWSGYDYMKEDAVARYLIENQIDFDYIPSDVFYDDDYGLKVNDKKLKISLGEYSTVVLPEYPLIRKEVVEVLNKSGVKVIAINSLPDITIDSDEKLMGIVSSLDDLKNHLKEEKEVYFSDDHKSLRYLHYVNDYDLYYFVNEGRDTYKGTLRLPYLNKPYIYDAYLNTVYPLDYVKENDEMVVKVSIEPRKSLIIYADGNEYKTDLSVLKKIENSSDCLELNSFKRSLCLGKEYPDFKYEKDVLIPDFVEDEYPDFGGLIKYDTDFELNSATAYLKIDEVLEGVEVYLNGHCLGIQLVPSYLYDLSPYLNKGKNHLSIVLATTLERFVRPVSHNPQSKPKEPTNTLGIRDKVRIYY